MFRIRSRFVVGALCLLAAGCGEGDLIEPMSPVPVPPTLSPGMAMLQGRVVAADRQPIAGAKVTVLDIPGHLAPQTATSDAGGNWQLTVLGNTTVTLKIEATGFAPTLSNAVEIATGASSTGMELMMVAPARIDELNMMGGPRVADYGVVAVDVVSVSGACDPTGGTVSINPAPLGRVFYGKADQSLPDSMTTTMQAGARPSAWVLGVLPPGAYYQLKFEKAGCTPRALPTAYSGRSYSGDLPIQAKALSHALLLVD